MTSLVLLVVAIVAMIGWHRALKHWQAAVDRERALCRELLALADRRHEWPSVTVMPAAETRH